MGLRQSLASPRYRTPLFTGFAWRLLASRTKQRDFDVQKRTICSQMSIALFVPKLVTHLVNW